MNVLVTGASGFIGSFLVEEAVRRGMTAWAGVRATSSRAYLRDEHIHFATLNLDKKDPAVLDTEPEQENEQPEKRTQDRER